MNRRGFLSAILAAGVAPAVVGSGILMPVRMVHPVRLFTANGDPRDLAGLRYVVGDKARIFTDDFLRQLYNATAMNELIDNLRLRT